MLDDVKRFDMRKKPMRMHLRPLLWLLCFFMWRKRGNRLKKVNMEGIKPPYLLLCNHNAFQDFAVAIRATMPHRVNFVVAIDGFIGREWLLRLIGCICKRKFTHDNDLIFHLRRVVRRGDVAALYPEARYSLCGTKAVLPDEFGRLAKFLRVPVVTLLCHGHHVNSPFFNLPDHGLKRTEATMTCLYTPEQIKELSVRELTEGINRALYYDDYDWLEKSGLKISDQRRAEGLHKVLYQCPHCLAEYKMKGEGVVLSCGGCGKKWEMTEECTLRALEGETEFSHIPDWYEWERAQVRREVEKGSYSFSCDAHVNALPNAKKFIPLGNARLTHDMTGFRLTGVYKKEKYEVFLPAEKQYSVHIEYEYLGKYGDCVDLNTLEDTLYVYPDNCLFSVTKISLATEELYKYYKNKK